MARGYLLRLVVTEAVAVVGLGLNDHQRYYVCALIWVSWQT